MANIHQLLDQAVLFLPALVRILSVFVVAPFFSTRSVPSQVKIGLACFVAMVVVPNLRGPGMDLQGPWLVIILLLIKESLIGLIIGFAAALTFYSLQIAGQIIDLQIGLSFANVVDPQSEASSPLFGNLYNVLAMLLFIGLEGDHAIISGVLESFQVIPIGDTINSSGLIPMLYKGMAAMFLIGVKLAIPAVAALFLTDVALAIVSKAVPQMNVFVVGMPAKLFVGFAILAIAMPAFVALFRLLFETMFQYMDGAIRLLGGSP